MKRAAFLIGLAVALAGCGRIETTHASGRRMIVLGVDGMDPQFLDAHWDALPNLNRLRHEGGFRNLATTVPPQSPVAWSSVITGMDPGGHGIYDFIRRDPVTHAPESSMAETLPPGRTLSIGSWVIPLSGGGVRSLRAGEAFWQALASHGIRATVIRMPANFPPAECEAESLAGMGTPDMEGSFGTFSFFSDDPAEPRTQVPGGRIVHVTLRDGTAVLPIDGPPNQFRRDQATARAELTAHVDPSAPVARFDLGDEQVVLRQGEWSDWFRADFRLIPGLKSASGIFRVYLKEAHPRLRVYVSPVNIDPESPELPISTPASYSRTLARALGPFYTQGIPEETSAYREGILDHSEFLQQSRKVLSDSLRMFRYELARFESGLLFYYFSSVDQNSHMLWGRYDGELLDIYRGVDEAVGEAMRKAGSDTPLVVMSDHGFAPFDRAVHLNSWLAREGYQALDESRAVNWAGTQAYAIGLNGIYLNLAGREQGGAVYPDQKRQILNAIAAKLVELRDPNTGGAVVDRVYFPEQVFRGRNLKDSPDLFIGFRRGYRASWQTALGQAPNAIIEDNTQAWIGDHCMASDEVPGVLLSNRAIRSPAPRLEDVTATVLQEFGVPRMPGMIGRSFLQ